MISTQVTSIVQHIVTNYDLGELKECETHWPQLGSQKARQRAEKSLKPVTHANLQMGSIKCTKKKQHI